MIATALYGIARLYSHLRKYIKFRHIAMNQQTKEVLYLSPDVMVFEVKTEGVICQSALRDGYGTANEGVDPSQLDGGIWNW